MVCSRAGSFRSSINQGFLPGPGVDMLIKKKVQAAAVAFRAGGARSRQQRLAKPEARICDTAKGDQIAVDGAAGRSNEPFGFLGVELELSGRAGHVPGEVLAAD